MTSLFIFLNNAHWAKASEVQVADEITEAGHLRAAS